MLTSTDKEALAQDISQWLAEGHIDRATYDTLAVRYEVRQLGLARILRYLGILGGVFTLLGVLGMLATLSKSLGLAMMICAGIAWACLGQGLGFVNDPQGRYPQSGRILITAGLLFWLGTLVLLGQLLGGLSTSGVVFMCGVLWLPVAFGIAYKYGNGFVLTLAVLGVYHWVGSWSAMLGHSTYALAIQDPRVMAGVALLGIFGGQIQREQPGVHSKTFATVYESVSLLYLNMSLLILGIGWGDDALRTAYVALGFIVSIGQVVMGARLYRPLYTGFGLTFTGIHLFTRYFESFWDKFDKGVFFLLGGGALLGAGLLLERVYRPSTSPVASPAAAATGEGEHVG